MTDSYTCFNPSISLDTDGASSSAACADGRETTLPAMRAESGRRGRADASRTRLHMDANEGPLMRTRLSDSAATPAGRALPHEIAVRYVPIIRRVALRLARRLPSHVSIDDLVSAGFVGLVDAYRRYDTARCDCFEPYADLRIRGAMMDELRLYDPLSRDVRALAKKANAATRRLATRLGRAPTDVEIAAEVGVPLDAYRSCAALLSIGSVSLDAPNGDAYDGMDLGDPSVISAVDEIALAESRRALVVAIDALPPRLRQVLRLYYGDELTLRNIGSLLGVTESRVCQLHAEAITRLRAYDASATATRASAQTGLGGENATSRTVSRWASAAGSGTPSAATPTTVANAARSAERSHRRSLIDSAPAGAASSASRARPQDVETACR